MAERRKNGMNRRLALGGGAAAALLAGGYLLSRSSGSTARHEIPAAGIFRRGNGSDPGSLDPTYFQTETEQNILEDLMLGLMTSDPAARPIPGMATSWTTSEDGLVWIFKLREALWSDGVPVTADDFVYSWQRLVDPKSAANYAYFLYGVKNAKLVNSGKLPLTDLGVRAPDSHTFEITLEHPAPYLLEMLTHMSLYPVPRHVVEAKGKVWAQPGNYVCNGPFNLTEWTPNEHITLVKNPRFYDAANVKLDKIIFYPTDDYAAALRRFRAGELDVQSRLAGEQIDWIKAHMPETLAPISQLTAEYISVNHTRPPFNDIRVRTALNLSVNREAIATKIRRMGDTPAYGIVPPGVANFPGGNSFDFKSLSYDQRVAKAQSLMREAGFGPGKRLSTTYMIRSTAAGTGRAVAAAVQQMFSLVYVDAAIVPNDFPIFIDTINPPQSNFDICQPAWGADFNDAETFLTLFETGGGNNWGQYSNPAFDALLAAEQKEVSLETRGKILAEAEALLLKDQAVIPLFFWVNPGMARPYVKGWVANSVSYHPSRWVSIDQKAREALFAGPESA
jgi:oligopeptide transport system substrate-binding protein